MKNFFQEDQLNKLKEFLLDFIRKYQIFNPESIDKYRFSKYQKILATLLLVFLFLFFIQLLGFSLGFSRFFLVNLSVLLVFILIAWEVKRRWPIITSMLKKIFVKNKLEKKNLALAIFLLLIKELRKLFKSIFLSRYLFLVIMIGAVIFNLRAVGQTSSIFLAVMVFLWFLCAGIYRLQGKLLVAVGLLFLLTCSLYLVSEKETVAEKMAAWTYVFLAVGTLQNLRERKKESERIRR